MQTRSWWFSLQSTSSSEGDIVTQYTSHVWEQLQDAFTHVRGVFDWLYLCAQSIAVIWLARILQVSIPYLIEAFPRWVLQLNWTEQQVRNSSVQLGCVVASPAVTWCCDNVQRKSQVRCNHMISCRDLLCIHQITVNENKNTLWRRPPLQFSSVASLAVAWSPRVVASSSLLRLDPEIDRVAARDRSASNYPRSIDSTWIGLRDSTRLGRESIDWIDWLDRFRGLVATQFHNHSS